MPRGEIIEESHIMDITDSIPLDKRRDGKKVLQKALQGTFCFAASDYFECKEGMTIARNETLELSGTFGPTVFGFSAGGVSVSVTETVGQSIDHRAGRCERCRIVVCKLDTTLKQWRVQKRFGPFKRFEDEVVIDPAETLYSPRCESNPNCRGCKGSTVYLKKSENRSAIQLQPQSVSLSTFLLEASDWTDSDGLIEMGADFCSYVSSLETANVSYMDVLGDQQPSVDLSKRSTRPGSVTTLITVDAIDGLLGGIRIREGSEGPVIPIVAIARGMQEAVAQVEYLGTDLPVNDTFTLQANQHESGFSSVSGFLNVPAGSLDEARHDRIRLSIQDAHSNRALEAVIPVRYAPSLASGQGVVLSQ